MTGRHRNEDKSPPGRRYSLLDHRRADVVLSIGCLLVVTPFGFTAVGIVAVMLFIGWFV